MVTTVVKTKDDKFTTNKSLSNVTFNKNVILRNIYTKYARF